MSKVFADMGISLDGYVAGPNAGTTNPIGDGGTRLHQWVFSLKSWRSALGFTGGETNDDDALVRASIDRTGAHVMGRKMFDEGEANWPENAPFRTPVFVVTHRAREPWVRPGGTTFHFVTGGVAEAIERAREAAGGKDVRISGGASVVRQGMEAGLVDELALHVAPVLLGAGTRLFDGFEGAPPTLRVRRALHSTTVTHVEYDMERSRQTS